MKKTLLSYLIPVFNSKKYIENCYKSLEAQTFKDFSIIFIDDGSSDGSLSILKKLAENDERVSLIKSNHKGIVSALNLGIKHTKADWIIRLDSDDLCAPFRTERILKEINNINEKYALITSDTYLIDNKGCLSKRIRNNKYLIEFNIFTGKNAIYHSSVAIKRSIFKDIGFYSHDYPHAEDFDLWLRLLMFYKIKHLNEPLIYYRVHNEQITKKNQIRSISSKYKSLTSFYSKNLKNKLIKNIIYNLIHEIYKIELKYINLKKQKISILNKLKIYLLKIVSIQKRLIFYFLNLLFLKKYKI